MSQLAISLFGNFEVSYQRSSSCIWEKGKVQELLSFLLLNKRAYTREFLATLLWQNIPTKQSRRYLRKTLWQLQQPLSNLLDNDERILIVETEIIQINHEFNLWCDVHILEEAFKMCTGIKGADLSSQIVQKLRIAIKNYRGDLLEGWFYDWCIIERERLQGIYLILLDRLIENCIFNGRFDEGIRYSFEVLAFDPAHERTHRHLMELYYGMGDRTRALRQFHTCTKILKKELNITPNKRTMNLLEQIATDELPSFKPPQPQTHDSEPHQALLNPLSLEALHHEISLTQQTTQAILHLIQQNMTNWDQ